MDETVIIPYGYKFSRVQYFVNLKNLIYKIFADINFTINNQVYGCSTNTSIVTTFIIINYFLFEIKNADFEPHSKNRENKTPEKSCTHTVQRT